MGFYIGAAEFADSQTMTINALNGASVELDTRIVYNGAGPSNMNQTVTLLQLFKGDQSGELVYFCSNEGPRREIPCPSTLRTIALTDSHKFDLTLLLENVSLSDSGAYLFRVEVLYPGVSSRSCLTKSFSMSIHGNICFTYHRNVLNFSLLFICSKFVSFSGAFFRGEMG